MKIIDPKPSSARVCWHSGNRKRNCPLTVGLVLSFLNLFMELLTCHCYSYGQVAQSLMLVGILMEVSIYFEPNISF